ncbi:MAG: RDD family protein [Nocardioides sp.]
MSDLPPPPAPGFGAPAAPPTGRQPGGLLDRFLARLIDGILLGIVNAVIVSAIIVGAVMGDSGGLYTASTYAATAVSAVVSTVIYVGYFAFMESSRGQTVGKMVMKLHTLGPDGGHPTLEQAVRRNIWMGAGILGLVPVLGWFSGLVELVAVILIAVGINNDPVNRQAWHDHFAGETRVVKET